MEISRTLSRVLNFWFEICTISLSFPELEAKLYRTHFYCKPLSAFNSRIFGYGFEKNCMNLWTSIYALRESASGFKLWYANSLEFLMLEKERERKQRGESVIGGRKKERETMLGFLLFQSLDYLFAMCFSLNKNRRELDAFKWEGSRTLFFNPSRSCWVEKISQIPTQHNPTQPNDSYTLLTMSIFLKPN